MSDVIVVGAGHNGLVAACYLAMSGRSVTVVEAADRPGGGSRTEETIPGYRFDLHSAAHNIINMTSIPMELDLAGAGLVYQEMDPFSVAIHADGRRVRFHRSLDQTVASIAELDRSEADAYRRFIDVALPVVEMAMPAIRGGLGLRETPRLVLNAARFARRSPMDRLGDLLGTYDGLLRRMLASDLTRGPVAAFAAHGGVGPTTPGAAMFAFWQAAYHLHGQWHAKGGAQGLVDALLVRATSLGVEVVCGRAVTRLETANGKVTAVRCGDERFTASSVIAAIDPRTSLLDLLDPALGGAAGAELAATRRSNVVQALVHVASTDLPRYRDARPGDWSGLQSYVDHLDDISKAWIDAEAAKLPDPLPLYAFTPSALDDTLCPPGHHTIYLACPVAPAEIDGGWDFREAEFVAKALAGLERRAPGFSDTIVGVHARTPKTMMAHDRWPGAHPMHLDLGLDQLGPFRPTRRLADHRSGIDGLYISGAGTAPTGGIAGTPGKLAAKALIKDQDARSPRGRRSAPAWDRRPTSML